MNVRLCLPQNNFPENCFFFHLSILLVANLTLGIIHIVHLQKFRKSNTSYCLTHTRTCAYQGVTNVIFSENFANVLNEWSLRLARYGDIPTDNFYCKQVNNSLVVWTILEHSTSMTIKMMILQGLCFHSKTIKSFMHSCGRRTNKRIGLKLHTK